MRIVTTGLLIIFVLVLAAGAFVGYEFYGAYQSLQNPSAAAVVPTTRVDGRDVVVFTTITADQLPGAIKDAEGKLAQNVTGKQAFALELSGTDLMALISARAGDRAKALPVSNTNVDVGTSTIAFTADLRGTVPVPMAATLTPIVQDGKLKLNLSGVRVGQLTVPADQIVGPLIDEALDVNSGLAASGAVALQSVELKDKKLRLVGLQREGALVDQAVAQRIKDQASRQPSPAFSAPSIPGADVVPVGSSISKPGNGLYLALGDSLTAGVGVSDKRQAFVSRFHAYLEKQTGQQLGLTNLGVSGESTASMLAAGQLQQALNLIKQRPSAVRVITLGIGANDLLGHLASLPCQTDPTSSDCQNRLQAGLKAFPANFKSIATQLAAAIDPSTQVVVVNAYNPFNFGTGLPPEQLSNQTVKALNDAMAAEATARGWKIADAGSAIGDRAAALTGILNGDVHPTELGYQAIAYAVSQAYKKP